MANAAKALSRIANENQSTVHKVIWLVATQECGTVLAAAFVVSLISNRNISWFTCYFFFSLDYLVGINLL